MRHRRYDRLGCPVEACTEVIGGKWKGEILFILFSGTKRHSELRKLIPDTTQRMLTTQLRELEENGVIERKVYAQVPPKVEYSISKRGRALKPVIDAMWDWGKNFLDTLPEGRLKPKASGSAASMASAFEKNALDIRVDSSNAHYNPRQKGNARQPHSRRTDELTEILDQENAGRAERVKRIMSR